MEFMEVIRERRSIRKYKDDPVPDDALKEILTAGQLAPSGANRQPWHFIVVRDPDTKESMDIPEWASRAPVVLAVCGDPEISGNWYVVDPTIALEHMILAAANRGLGTCWVGKLNRDERVKEALGVPDHMHVIAVTPIGYPDESPKPKGRKKLEEIVHFDGF